MSVDKRTMAIWEMEFLKCQTSNSLKNYIIRYVNEPENPYVNMAKAKLNESNLNIQNIKLKRSANRNNNWLKDNGDILLKITLIVISIGGAYFIEEGYTDWKNKRNAEYNMAQMETILRQTEQTEKLIQAMNVQLQERLNNLKNNTSDISVKNHQNNQSNTFASADYGYAPFAIYGINNNEVINEYTEEVASRQTPQEFLNDHWGSDCKSCHGTKKCPICDGTKITSTFGNTYICEICNDNGDCPACGGSGLASWNR